MPKLHAPSLAEHSDRTWMALTQALDELLATMPYDEISMSRVAAAAGMARNTLYNYAPDKAQLVAAITGRASAGLLESVTRLTKAPGQPLERIEAIIRDILGWFVAEGHRHVVARGLFAGEAADAARGPADEASAPLYALQARVASLVVEGIECGELRRPPDLELTLELMSSIMRSCVQRVVRQPSDLTVVTQEALRIVRACIEPDRADTKAR